MLDCLSINPNVLILKVPKDKKILFWNIEELKIVRNAQNDNGRIVMADKTILETGKIIFEKGKYIVRLIIKGSTMSKLRVFPESYKNENFIILNNVPNEYKLEIFFEKEKSEKIIIEFINDFVMRENENGLLFLFEIWKD